MTQQAVTYSPPKLRSSVSPFGVPPSAAEILSQDQSAARASRTAVVLPGDDPAARSRTLPYQWDAAIGRMMGSAPLTVRIDLDPPSPG
jgi:hypothetical protein